MSEYNQKKSGLSLPLILVAILVIAALWWFLSGGNAVETVGDAAGDAAAVVEDTAGDAAEAAGDAVEGAADAVEGAVEDATTSGN